MTCLSRGLVLELQLRPVADSTKGGDPVSKRLAALLALVFAVASTSVFACPGDKMKDDKADSGQMSPKPKT